MKALPMLDHVMLGIARGFSLIFLSLTLWWGLLLPWWNNFLSSILDFRLLLIYGLTIAWTFSLWNYTAPLNRVYLGVSSILALFHELVFVVPRWCMPNSVSDIMNIIVCHISVWLGLLSFTVVALRAPHLRKYNSILAHPLHHPVNPV
jgi:hypothetical protein